MAKLDKSKPFGTIFGDAEGRVFEQDGSFFRGDGSPWTAAGDTPAKPAAPKGKPKADPAPADDQLAAQLGDAAGQ